MFAVQDVYLLIMTPVLATKDLIGVRQEVPYGTVKIIVK